MNNSSEIREALKQAPPMYFESEEALARYVLSAVGPKAQGRNTEKIVHVLGLFGGRLPRIGTEPTPQEVRKGIMGVYTKVKAKCEAAGLSANVMFVEDGDEVAAPRSDRAVAYIEMAAAIDLFLTSRKKEFAVHLTKQMYKAWEEWNARQVEVELARREERSHEVDVEESELAMAVAEWERMYDEYSALTKRQLMALPEVEFLDLSGKATKAQIVGALCGPRPQ